MRLVETLNENAGLVVDRQAERPLRPAHALAAQIIASALEQRGKKGGVIDALQQTKMPGCVVVFRQMRVVDDAGDAPDWRAIAKRHKSADIVLLN